MEPKIVFVQDALPYWGGAERLLTAALEVYPDAPLYTLIYNREAFQGTAIAGRQVRVSPLDRLPGARRHHKAFLPLMPLALETLDLRQYDIIVSFSYAVAHAAPTHAGQLHISYIHTPMRYAWRQDSYLNALPGFGDLPGRLLKPLLSAFRLWDKAMLKRTHAFLTNSHWMAGIIQSAYQRQASVLYPPLNIDRFSARQPRVGGYLYVGRLVAHKRVDILIDAFAHLRLPLCIIGAGPDESRLRALAAGLSASNIQFLGWQGEEQVASYLACSRAFVHAGEEDFGIAMTEAQAAGCPVIALGCGGAAEIVSHGKTGLLFAGQDAASLAGAVRDFEAHGVEYSPDEIRAHASRFDQGCFQCGFKTFIEARWAAFSSRQTSHPNTVPMVNPSKAETIYGCGA